MWTRGQDGTDHFAAHRVSKILLLPGQIAGVCESLHRKRVASATGRVMACAASGTYIFTVLYGNLPAQFGMLAEAVAGQAEPRHQAGRQPAFARELLLQIGVCARLAKECVNAIRSAHRAHVKQA